MRFKAKQFKREGSIKCAAAIQKVFPLLCPKREEEWIPGWECETIWSESGYNEAGAVFHTTKPYGTELYWNTLVYDINKKLVDFLITAPGLYMFRFEIVIDDTSDRMLGITFRQTFTSVSQEGSILISRYEGDDFNARLKDLERFMNSYLEPKLKNKFSGEALL
jgi:hypothetical protein